MARGQEKPAQGLSKSAAEANLHASERKPYDSGASEILDDRFLAHNAWTDIMEAARRDLFGERES